MLSPSFLQAGNDVPTEDPTSCIITNVRLPHTDRDLSSKLWRVECRNGQVGTVSLLGCQAETSNKRQLDARGGLMLPFPIFCFILDRCQIVTGQFNEAMEVTGRAKAAFPLDLDDLYRRGTRLILESVQCGVTSMRAHVEVDKIVGSSCLDVAQALQSRFKNICLIQIAVFAQEPIFDAPGDVTPGINFKLLQQVLQRDGIAAVGSAPYVEPTTSQAKTNISLIMQLAKEYNLHVDFHLDYNLDPTSEPLIYEVLSQARENIHWWGNVKDRPDRRRITIGHATRLQLFSPVQWHDLERAIRDLPITFVGLPQSDIYMQGREYHDQPLGPPRSTLRVPYILDKYGIEVAMSVNNVGNAFTPQGSLDPLSLCTFCVALFQSATPADIQTLVRSITSTSKLAIGLCQEVHKSLMPMQDSPADFVIVHGAETLLDAVLNPPYERTTIRNGVVVSHRHAQTWFLDVEAQDVVASSGMKV